MAEYGHARCDAVILKADGIISTLTEGVLSLRDERDVARDVATRLASLLSCFHDVDPAICRSPCDACDALAAYEELMASW